MLMNQHSVRPQGPMPAAERMRRYRARRRQQGLHAVTRWEPVAGRSLPDASFSAHRILEARSLAMHCLIVRKIDEDRRLLEKARENLRRWRRRAGREVPAYIAEWEKLLETPWPQLAAAVIELSERGARLRQSSPFAGVLTPSERQRIYEAFRA